METIFEAERCYHIFNHAIGIENLFRNRENYLYYMKKYSHYIQSVGNTYAYCLMPNHFHFLVKIKTEAELIEFYKLKHTERKNQKKLQALIENPSSFDVHDCVMQEFQNFLTAYAKAYNKMYNRNGGLFLHFLKRKLVDTDAYFTKAIHYIHYNPIHHGFCKNILDWEFSSLHAILGNKTTKLEREAVIDWFGNKQAFWQFHQTKPDNGLENDMEFL